MIVAGWNELVHAIDKAVPCYSPLLDPAESRCRTCEPCLNHERVEALLAVVDDAIRDAIDDAIQDEIREIEERS